MYGSGAARKGLRDENRHDRTGKVYTECTAAALRAKDCVMKTVTTVQENAEDILAEAQQINEERAAQEAAAVQETEEDGADLSGEGTTQRS